MLTATAAASGRTCRNSRCASNRRATASADANTGMSPSLPVAGTSMVLIIGSPRVGGTTPLVRAIGIDEPTTRPHKEILPTSAHVTAGPAARVAVTPSTSTNRNGHLAVIATHSDDPRALFRRLIQRLQVLYSRGTSYKQAVQHIAGNFARELGKINDIAARDDDGVHRRGGVECRL